MSDALIARLRSEGTGANQQRDDPDYPMNFLHAHGDLCLQAADALSALREERDRLRAALRLHAIEGFESKNGHGNVCNVCHHEWLLMSGPGSHAAESHAPGCLAALQSEGSDR